MIDKLAILVSNFVICWSIYQLWKYEKSEADNKKQIKNKVQKIKDESK
ncbi:hypothetical protein [Brumicola nitratireducens]|uniref:Uncharacterized protein n=1 Tax=Glaciecola nitratireducens (strain JCM 12485 / KCTC 12276 / FR1064) TaxID=1085623 RepID=G4QI40_GLANF|nr:hypothetical protein [Glaciecola nitratireducens]AEP30654.1 hypothetical protein GNIT_2557 [Glaciecola nitratireducens FR1064]